MKKAIAVLFAVSILLGAGYGQAVTFQDGEFQDSSWSAEVVYSVGDVSFSAGQVAVGGNPDAYRETTHELLTAGTIYVVHLMTGATYAPSAGAITGIACNVDVKKLPSQGGDIDYEVALKQGGKVYISGENHFSSEEWSTLTISGLVESNFIEVTDEGLWYDNHPDFSSAGAPIQFGYFSADQTLSSRLLIFGVDNWEVIVTTEAPPAWAPADAEAAVYGPRSATASGPFNALFLVLLPCAVAVLLRAVRRQR